MAPESKEEMAQAFEEFLDRKEKIKELLQSQDEKSDETLGEAAAELVMEDILEDLDLKEDDQDTASGAISGFLTLVASIARELRS